MIICWICRRTVRRRRVSLHSLFSAPSPPNSDLVDSSLTRQAEQYQPINHQDGPKHRHVKDTEPSAHEPYGDGPRARVPELELGQAPDKGPELLILSRRESAHGAVFHALVLFDGRVEFRLEEGEEEVEEVDCQGVAYCAVSEVRSQDGLMGS